MITSANTQITGIHDGIVMSDEELYEFCVHKCCIEEGGYDGGSPVVDCTVCPYGIPESLRFGAVNKG